PAIEDLLRRCLRRDMSQRVQAIGDVRIALEEYLSDPQAHQAWQSREQPTAMSSARKLFLTAAALILATVTFFVGWALRPSPPVTAPTSRFALVLPQDQAFSYSGRHQLALSPDGRHLVYSANGQLYHRAMDQLAAKPIAGTLEGGGRNPFFSPDGQWIGFWAGGEIRKVPVGGGSPETLCQAGNPFGANWVSERRILFGQGEDGIFEVPADGGEKKLLIEVDSSAGEMAHGPQLLPGGKDIIFTLGLHSDWDQAQIVVQSLETGDRKVIVSGGKDARFLPSGHLVYSWKGSLWAVPFDPLRVELTGSAFLVVEKVSESGNAFTGAVHFSTSQSGALAYVPGTGGSITSTVVWIDRTGQEENILADQFYEFPRISPDGERIVLTLLHSSGTDIWVHDLERLTRTRLTFEGSNQLPKWSPDGTAVIFASNHEGESHLYSKSADGTGQAERLTTTPGVIQVPGDFTPDGNALVFQRLEFETSTDLYLLSLDSNRTTRPLLKTRFNEVEPAISPDGRWIAYVSDESGRHEVYVRPFPDVEQGKWQISTSGGRDPLWDPQGTEVYYLNNETLMASSIDATDTFSSEIPRVVVKIPDMGTSDQSEWGTDWDISPDGQRFLITTNVSESGNQAELVVVLNWFEELQSLVPRR
ncbi:MAG: PD40 domain-containing protein, partial [Acidobacteriota bacterium]